MKAATNWPLRNGEVAVAVVVADERVLLGAVTDEIAVGHPLRLHELELPLEMRANQEEDATALGAVVVEHALRQGRPVVGAPPQEVVEIDGHHLVLEGIARIDPPHVRAEGTFQSLHVIGIREHVVAVPVAPELRIVAIRCQYQGRAAAPAAHHLCGNQLLLLR